MPAATLQTLGELASDKSNLLMVLSGLTRDKVDQVSAPPPSPARGGAAGPRARDLTRQNPPPNRAGAAPVPQAFGSVRAIACAAEHGFWYRLKQGGGAASNEGKGDGWQTEYADRQMTW